MFPIGTRISSLAAVLVSALSSGCFSLPAVYGESWAEPVKLEADACPVLDGEYQNAGEQFHEVERGVLERSARSLAHVLNGGDSQLNDGAPRGTRPSYRAEDRLGETWHDPGDDAYLTIRLRLIEGKLHVAASLADGSTRTFDLPTRQRCRDSSLVLEPSWYGDTVGGVANLVGRDTLALGRAEDGSLLVRETRTRELFMIWVPYQGETSKAVIRFAPVAPAPEQPSVPAP